MSSVSLLLLLIGLFIIVNTINGNLVGVVDGTKKLNVDWGTSTTSSAGQTPVVNAQTGFVTGTKSLSGG